MANVRQIVPVIFFMSLEFSVLTTIEFMEACLSESGIVWQKCLTSGNTNQDGSS